MNEIEKFVNTRYRILRYLIENKDRNNIVHCTQEEIGTALSLSRGTINRVLSELKNDGYLEESNHYWEYKLTSKAIGMAKTLNLR
jgi:DNA-binding IclR family transcriptional regulator